MFVYTEDGLTYAYDLPFFQQTKVETEEAVSAAYEGMGGEWVTVTLKPFTAGTDRDIKRLARVPGYRHRGAGERHDCDDQRGFVIDEIELPAARAATCGASWPFLYPEGHPQAGQPIPVTKEGFNALPGMVARLIDVYLAAQLGGAVDAHFFKLWMSSVNTSSESRETPSTV